MNLGTISNSNLYIKPSRKLYSYAKDNLNILAELPNRTDDFDSEASLCMSLKARDSHHTPIDKDDDKNFGNTLLALKDLYCVYERIEQEGHQVYLHELLEGSQIVLPKNKMIPRDEGLEKRCQLYRNIRSNREYRGMTKKVDTTRRKNPEDTISFQLKQMNKHLIIVLQFILSVLTGFTFGFIGLDIMIGTIDFGYRILIGIFCALIVGLAEFYFLFKALSEEYNNTI